MEVIADLDFEPVSDLDNIFRNSVNDCEYTFNDCREYIQFLSQNEYEYLDYLLSRLIYNKVDEEEVRTYLLEKYELYPETCNDMIKFICDMLTDNDEGLYYCSSLI